MKLTIMRQKICLRIKHRTKRKIRLYQMVVMELIPMERITMELIPMERITMEHPKTAQIKIQ